MILLVDGDGVHDVSQCICLIFFSQDATIKQSHLHITQHIKAPVSLFKKIISFYLSFSQIISFFLRFFQQLMNLKAPALIRCGADVNIKNQMPICGMPNIPSSMLSLNYAFNL
jgi:hypothetical protein